MREVTKNMSSHENDSPSTGVMQVPLQNRDAVKKMEFEELAVPQMNNLYIYALHLTKNKEAAKDVLQETYLKAYRFWDKFEQGTNLRAWLCRIMRNSFINQYRKTKREPQTSEFNEAFHVVEDHDEHVPDIDMAPDYIPEGSFSDDVLDGLASLPKKYKVVVILTDIQGYSYEEVAKLIHCPVGTVRSRLHRGRMMLGEYLKDYAKENGIL